MASRARGRKQANEAKPEPAKQPATASPLMRKKVFETLWGGLAAFYIIVTLHFVALSQGWPWYIDSGIAMTSDDQTDKVVKAVAAYFGAPICGLLTIAVIGLGHVYMRRHGGRKRWQRLPVPWDLSIPSTDPLGRWYRTAVWFVVLVACPFGFGHLVNQTWDGTIWMECNVAAGAAPPTLSECEAAESRAAKSGASISEVYFSLGENFGAHLRWPPVYSGWFTHRYRFESENGYTYFPFVHAVVLIWLCFVAGVELLRVVFLLFRPSPPREPEAEAYSPEQQVEQTREQTGRASPPR